MLTILRFLFVRFSQYLFLFSSSLFVFLDYYSHSILKPLLIFFYEMKKMKKKNKKNKNENKQKKTNKKQKKKNQHKNKSS